MLAMSMLLVSLLTSPVLDISVVDSRDDAKMVYIIINNCKVKVDKRELKDYDRLIEKVFRICGYDY